MICGYVKQLFISTTDRCMCHMSCVNKGAMEGNIYIAGIFACSFTATVGQRRCPECEEECTLCSGKRDVTVWVCSDIIGW